MNKNMIAAFGGGLLVAGLGAWMLQRPAATPVPTKEVVVASVEQPKTETPEPVAPPVVAAPAVEPVRRWRSPEAGEKPAPRRVRPAAEPVVTKTVTEPQKGHSGVAPRTDAPPLPVFVAGGSDAAPAPKASTPAQPAVQEDKPAAVAPPPPPPAPKREPQSVTIGEGTSLVIRTSERLSSERSQPGDTFQAVLAEPLVVDGFVLAERGARVNGRVVESLAAGRVKGVAKLSLELTQVTLSDGQRIALTTDAFVREGDSSRKNDAAKVGAGAAIGAALGAIIGGGKGAAVGAATGAGAGGGVVLATRGKPVEIESEARLPFRLNKSLKVTEKLN